ncbi:MAG: exosome complex protein Rrp42 [Candidatus Pacearchaeota archaeon]
MEGEGSIETTPKVTIERIKQYLREGKRFDGREFDGFRDLVVDNNVSKKAEGSVKVKLGNTEVMAGVKVKVGEPFPDAPDEGNLIVSAELSPLSSQRYESGPPQADSIELARVIDRGIREGGVVDMNQLAIKSGEKIWTVFVDLYALNDDGNLLDAFGIAALGALMDAKLPKYDEENDEVLYDQPEKDMPLTDTKIFPITIRKIGGKLIVDPTKEEEDASEGRLTIGTSGGSISSMQKGEIDSFTEEEIMNSIEIADKIESEILEKIEKALKK